MVIQWKYLTLISVLFLGSCSSQTVEKTNSQQVESTPILNPSGNTISTRFSPPMGCSRNTYPENSFAYYLRNFSLKPHGSPVLFYTGNEKKPAYHAAVLDIDIGQRDLQQCADAVMRLRGEYLFDRKAFDKIAFNFVSDGKPRYFSNYAKGDYSQAKFRKYMNYIFSYANTGSLYDQTKKIDPSELQAGDFFIEKGSPYGHAIQIVDVCTDSISGKKRFLMAQSYMPAQSIHILINEKDPDISPWYKEENIQSTFQTPEWTFNDTNPHRF